MKRFRYVYLIAPTAYLAISYLSLAKQNFPNPISVSWIQPDKLVHTAMYFTLALVSIIELSKLGKLKSPKSVILWAFIVPISFGGLMEILQQFVPNRSCDIIDFLANTIGVILAYVLYRVLFVRLSWISPDRSPLPGRGRGSR